MNGIILWQLEVFLLAFFVLTVLSSLKFHGNSSQIYTLRMGFASICILTLVALLPFGFTLSLRTDTGSSIEYLSNLLHLISPALAGIVGVFAAVKLVSLSHQYRALRKEVRAYKEEQGGSTFELLNQLCDQLGVSSAPKLYISENFDGACTFGTIHPAILISEEIASDSSRARIALLHELNHVVHNDWIWDQISRLCSSIFPLDFLVKKLKESHQRVIEQRCDQLCIRQGIDNLQYASFLYELTKDRLFYRNGALHAAELSSVGERVEILIKNTGEQADLTSSSRLALSTLILSLGVLLGITNFELGINEPNTPYSILTQYLGHEPAEDSTVVREEPEVIPEPEFPSLPEPSTTPIPVEDIRVEVILDIPQDEPLHIEPP